MSDTKAQSNNNRTLYIIIGLLSLAVIYLGYQLTQKSTEVVEITGQYDTLTSEKSELEQGLQEMLQQYDTLNIENEEMRANIMQQKQEIEELLDRVQKLKKDDKALRWEIDKLKKEAGTLREIMKGYLVTIDSLNTQNKELVEENTQISQQLTNVSTQKDQLESQVNDQQEIIKAGSVLTAVTFSAEAIRVRSSGVQKETSRASRAEMVKSCVSLAKNNITKKGAKTLYLRVISPEGKVLDDKNNIGKTFNFNGVSGKYSAKRQFEYNGELQDICVYHTVSGELTPGQYIVEMYESGALVGKTSFDLR